MNDTATIMMKGDSVYHTVDNTFWTFSAVLTPEEALLSGRKPDGPHPYALIFPNEACMRTGEGGIIVSIRYILDEDNENIAALQRERSSTQQDDGPWTSADLIKAYTLGVVNMAKNPDDILVEIARVNALEEGRGIVSFIRYLRQNRDHIVSQVSNDITVRS